MLSRLFDTITSSAGDAALNAFWVSVGGAVLTAVGLIWAYLRGAGRHVLWGLAGAFIGVVGIFAATLILLWSGPKVFVAILLLTSIAAVAGGIAAKWAARAALVANAERGVFDYWEQNSRAQKSLTKALTGITKETENLGNVANKHAAAFVSIAGEPELRRMQYGRKIAGKAAKDFDSSARRFQRSAAEFQDATTQFIDGMNGLLEWQQQNHGTESVASAITGLTALRDTVTNTLSRQTGLRNSVSNTPRMTRELTVAIQSLSNAIEVSINGMQATLDFCNNALGRLAG